MVWLAGILVLIVLIALILVSIYNRIILLKNRYENAFSQIDVQLTRRYDLIPNLLETAKAYMAHEKDTFEAVVRARNGAVTGLRNLAANPGNPEAMQNFTAAEQGFAGTLSRFMALSEAYPELKANENMQQLSEELSDTENRVAFARQAYNDAATAYNVLCQQFPSNFVASFFSFRSAALFEIEDPAKRQAVKISF